MTMQTTPTTVSIIIPAYNPGRYIDCALESVRAQSVRPLELVIIDDGSRPPVSADAFGDLPIRLLRQENAGQAAARNRGIREARGTWLAFLDADDVWHPRKLERQLRAAETHPEAAIIGCRAVLIDAGGSAIGAGPGGVSGEITRLDRRQFQLGAARAVLVPSMALVKRETALAADGFDTRYQPIEDLAYFDRLFDAGARAVVVEEYLLQRRLHGASLTLRYRQMLNSYRRWISEIVAPNADPAHVAAVMGQACLVTGLSALACRERGDARALLRRARQSGTPLSQLVFPFIFTLLPGALTDLARSVKQRLAGRTPARLWSGEATNPVRA
ncbi:MAG TPA: glycosyltransferase [Candidatus Ozemobacteraceae bacterium]|nr:glycosyltransferase [Candidatus Ozemobacteraceae bacterium]